MIWAQTPICRYCINITLTGDRYTITCTHGLETGVGEGVGVGIDGLALDLVGVAGVVAEAADDGTDVTLRHGDGLAVVQGLDGGEEVCVLLGDIGQLVQKLASLLRGDFAPLALEGLAGCGYSNVDILLCGLADGADDFLSRGVDNLEGLLVTTLNPLVVDEAVDSVSIGD